MPNEAAYYDKITVSLTVKKSWLDLKPH